MSHLQVAAALQTNELTFPTYYNRKMTIQGKHIYFRFDLEVV